MGAGSARATLRLGSVIVLWLEPGDVRDRAGAFWAILRQPPPDCSNPSGHRRASSLRRFSTASRVLLVDCWVVVCVTSLRDWLDNEAVESAPVAPLGRKPPRG